MAVVELAALTSPVSDEEPCGPDLELAGDADYMNYMARAEGIIPTSYFSGPDGKPFDRTSVDFASEFEAIKPLLARTRDLRLLTILAKMLILNRDLAGFETCVSAIGALLEQRWDDVHPRGEDGIFAARIAAIETLDDMPPVIMPLQHLPIAESRRFGAVSYRSYMIANGEVKPREGEEAFEIGAVEQALMETELSQLVSNRAHFDTVSKALANIQTVCIDRSSGEMVKLERLPPFVQKIFDLLNDFVTRRDPSAALATVGGEAAQPADAGAPAATIAAGLIRSPADAAAGLAAVADYFSRFEPSNPALLLVRQAEQLMGKSFLEVIRILVPTHVEQAAILLGKDQMVELPLERLSAFAEVNPSPTAAWESEAPSAEPDSDDGAPEAADAGSDGSESVEAAERAEDAPRSQPQQNGGGAPARQIAVQSRRDAIALLDQIGVYYRGAEPSSPVPCIVERARSLAERDFLSLLKDLLPEGAFKSPSG
jgi:type VI secretion system protein ImpA